MGLRDEIQISLKEAFDTDLADIIVGFVLEKSTIGEYDVSLGTNAKTTTTHNSRGLFEAMPTLKANGTSVLFTDEQLVLIANELNTNLEVDNKITLTDGTVYLVIAPNPVMGANTVPIIYEAQVRKNG